jgi:hypothetical protein
MKCFYNWSKKFYTERHRGSTEFHRGFPPWCSSAKAGQVVSSLCTLCNKNYYNMNVVMSSICITFDRKF